MRNVGYNLRLVGKSLRRDPWFTVVMVLGQALSVSIFVTALTTSQRYANMTGQVRGDVFRVERDPNTALVRFYRGTQFEVFGEFSANYVSVPTVRALAATGLATASTVNFVSVATGGPVEGPANRLAVRFCDAGFFEIFDVPFRYGGPFTRADERISPPAAVVVLSDLLNQKLYGGADSTGRTIRISGHDFRVAGVMRQRAGKLNLWDFGVAPENIANVVVPFAFADVLRPMPVFSYPPVATNEGWHAIAESPSGVTEYWLRLPAGEARTQIKAVLASIGPHWLLRPANEIAGRFSKPPPPYRIFVILTLVVLEVSVINLMRMLLAKATSRAAEIGIHRALGAGRNVIFTRQLLEGVVVSMVGSLLGLALAIPTVTMFDRLIPDLPVRLAVTPTIVATTLLICLLAGLVSGIYPAWRIASVAPTRYLGKI
ncbi:MAG TPA: ABC transporter permease [Polyangia bacterium]|nr:ABC transporter permease [Polyangia bacterium]